MFFIIIDRRSLDYSKNIDRTDDNTMKKYITVYTENI